MVSPGLYERTTFVVLWNSETFDMKGAYMQVLDGNYFVLAVANAQMRRHRADTPGSHSHNLINLQHSLATSHLVVMIRGTMEKGDDQTSQVSISSQPGR